ncbi:unnamed protein product, partial [Ectocarpus sp. 12 AP-2014]
GKSSLPRRLGCTRSRSCRWSRPGSTPAARCTPRRPRRGKGRRRPNSSTGRRRPCKEGIPAGPRGDKKRQRKESGRIRRTCLSGMPAGCHTRRR